MLAIGRALMSKPKLLLLDEPSLGLAPKIVAQVGELVMQLNSEGMSILLVEQNARLALQFAGRGYVLESGEMPPDDEPPLGEGEYDKLGGLFAGYLDEHLQKFPR